MRHPFTPAAGMALLGTLALWNCGGGGGGSAAASPTSPTPTASAPAPAPTPTTTVTPSAPTTVTVAIVASTGNRAFDPNPVKANSGDTVMFRNSDSVMHHLVMDDGSADLGDIAPGATSRGMTLRSAAATNFHCTLHSSMVGSINGASAPEPPACIDPYGYGCN
jgi:plastocyanin